MAIREPESKRRSFRNAPIAVVSEPSSSNRRTATTSRLAALRLRLPGLSSAARKRDWRLQGLPADSVRPEFDYALTTIFEPSDSSRRAFCT